MIVPAEGQFRLDREADTERLGAAIARELKRREAVCLSGPLGAGKSSLARALIRQLTGEATEAPSPTFTLVQSYDTSPPVSHYDLYRLKNARELEQLGFDDALADGAVLVEWPERAPEALHVRLGAHDGVRTARLTGPARWENHIHV